MALFLIAQTPTRRAPATGAVQESQEEEPGLPPLTAFIEAETRRVEEQIQGAWSLIDFYTPTQDIKSTDVSGFATFTDGFFLLILRTSVLGSDFFETQPEFYVQAQVDRYRIEDGAVLQTASVLGFNNANPDGELDFIIARIAREFDVLLADGELTLTNRELKRLTFRRVGGSDFPHWASDYLQRSAGGAFDDPTLEGRR